jgi:Bacterial antitoxin of type II TA system, VapB
MRTTLSLDDGLLAKAQRLTSMTEKTALVRTALGALIERESSRRLARLGGSEPALAGCTSSAGQTLGNLGRRDEVIGLLCGLPQATLAAC